MHDGKGIYIKQHTGEASLVYYWELFTWLYNVKLVICYHIYAVLFDLLEFSIIIFNHYFFIITFLLTAFSHQRYLVVFHWNLRDSMDPEVSKTVPVLIMVWFWRCQWCNGYRRRNWTRPHEFKSWTWLIAFHIALIPFGKVWIQFILPPAMGKWKGRLGSSALVRQLV